MAEVFAGKRVAIVGSGPGDMPNRPDLIKNKYFRWYSRLIDRAIPRSKMEGMEKHHILPKSLGGSNCASNIVSLTYREHFLAHWLLVKFTIGAAKRKMSFALWTMIRSPKGRRSFSSWQYAIARKAQLDSVVGRVVSASTRAKIVASKKNISDETRRKISATKKAQMTPEIKAAISARNRARIVTPESRAKMSAAQSKRSHRPEHSAKMLGHTVSEETRQKMSASRKAYWERKRLGVAI